MLTYQPLDLLPIIVVYLLTVAILMISIEVGYRLGSFFQKRWPDHSESGVNAMVGASLASLGFLLAFIASIAANIFNSRLELVINEADVIGTTYLARVTWMNQFQKNRENCLESMWKCAWLPADRSQLDNAINRFGRDHQELWKLAKPLLLIPHSDKRPLYRFLESAD